MWNKAAKPKENFLSRFRMEIEETKDALIFWEEWEHTPPKYPLKSYGIFLKLKETKDSTDSTVEMWVEKKVSKRKGYVKCTDPAPINALIEILGTQSESVTKNMS